MRRRGLRGALASSKPSGLEDSDLGDLVTVRDAQRWLQTIGRAVATGKLKDRDATAAIRAVEAWLSAERDRVASDELSELKAQLAELREGLKHGRALGVVS